MVLLIEVVYVSIAYSIFGMSVQSTDLLKAVTGAPEAAAWLMWQSVPIEYPYEATRLCNVWYVGC